MSAPTPQPLPLSPTYDPAAGVMPAAAPAPSAPALDPEMARLAAQAGLTPEQAAEGSATFLDRAFMTNLDEMAPPPISVTFMEWESIGVVDDAGAPVLDEAGQQYMRRLPRPRRAIIQSFVPTSVFNKVMAAQQIARSSGADNAAQMDIMADGVLPVWQLSEPWMTREKLLDGLDFMKMAGLFVRFFAQATRLMSGKASGVATTTASAPSSPAA